MERDFLGAIGKGSGAVKEEIAGRPESDYLGGAQPMQWQFPAKAGAAPAPFMSFRSARDEDSRKGVSDHFSFSGFRPPPPAGDTLDVIKKQASPVMHHQQMQFGFDGQVSPQQYAAVVHGHRARGMASYGVASHHPLGGSAPFRHPVRSNPGNPMHRVQSLPGGFPVSNMLPSSTVGVYGARDLPNPNSTQMTIFYNGSVNVFDNVSVEKAHQLMLLASRASIPSPPSAAYRSDLPISATVKLAASEVLIQKPESSVPHVSGISSLIPTGSQALAQSKSSSSSNNDTTGPKSVGAPLVVAPVSQASSSKPMAEATTATATTMPIAVPQSRKASLARFLEKRKERVSSVMPYPSLKSPLEESSDTLGSSGSAPSKSSCIDVAPLRNNGEESISPGQSKNISFGSAKFPVQSYRSETLPC